MVVQCSVSLYSGDRFPYYDRAITVCLHSNPQRLNNHPCRQWLMSRALSSQTCLHFSRSVFSEPLLLNADPKHQLAFAFYKVYFHLNGNQTLINLKLTLWPMLYLFYGMHSLWILLFLVLPQHWNAYFWNTCVNIVFLIRKIFIYFISINPRTP